MASIRDDELSDKISAALQQAKTILDAIAENPKTLRNARKFLVVYIDGIANATSSYTTIEEDRITPETRQKLLNLMDDVETRVNPPHISKRMSRRGNCYDNAVAESFFHSLKTELTHHMKFETRSQANQAIFEYY